MPFDPAVFFDEAGPWATLAQFLWVAQLALIFHVYKTGRPYWWMYILFIAPAIGGIAYVLIEMLPEWNASRGSFWRPRALQIRDLRRSLEESDVVKTRLLLAEELLAAGEKDEAYRVAEEALTGVFKDDPHTLAVVARIRIEAGKPEAGLEALARINTKNDRMLDLDVAVMRGRGLYATGRYEEAVVQMRAVEGRYLGEEARYFLALALKATGKKEEARQVLEDIVKKFRRAGRAWRRTERHWFRLANAELKAMAS
jgi:hypothetical protein